jgi:hypothetical protein
MGSVSARSVIQDLSVDEADEPENGQVENI